ncbi:MAG: ISKra4 family transposase [Deltaproteobacteria bacterium]|nr:ISKra4 family transposase [Deltaproteobacteria bacterium]
MKASMSTNPVANELTLTIRDVNWEEIQHAPFYEGECQVRALLQLLGQELIAHLLQSKDVSTPSLELAGQSYYRKEASAGHYQTLYGEVVVSRHLYQSSAGGATLCPLELHCQLSFGAATPLLAEVVSFKLASQTASEVAQDLAKSQGVTLSATYLHHLAQQVGQLALDKRAAWHLQSPAPTAPITLIATGLDGTTMPLVGEDYKEAMCGTIALYDTEGTRLHTEYLGAMPEAGKATFGESFTTRVAWVKELYPDALHVCVGDGARWNWDFFATHYPEAVWVLDFYHAATHLHTAAEAIFGQGPEAEAYSERWRTTLRDEEGGVAQLLGSLLYYRNRAALSVSAQRALDTELNYFRQHAELMQYADFRAAGLPIGSGVTEAGCKELIKARFCRSGRRWKRASGAPILQLRAIKLSRHWDSFWSKVMRYAA